MDDDIPEPAARHAFGGKADPTDALIAFADVDYAAGQIRIRALYGTGF
jgi:hypothetical protein